MKKFNILTLLMILGLQCLHAEFIPYKQYWLYPMSNRNIRLDNRNNRVAQGNNVQAADPNNHLAQRWKIDEFKNGVVLRTMSNEKFVIENNGGQVANGNNICIKEFNGSPQQIWIMEECEPNVYIFRNADDLNFVMTFNGNVELAQYAGSPDQKWYIERSKPLINIERDKNGHLILAPHDFLYETPNENHYIMFDVYDEPGECSVGIENEESRSYNSIYGETANYSYDGRNLTVRQKNGETWSGIISDDGTTLIMKKGATTRTYRIVK